MENKTKARCQVSNKSVQTKLKQGPKWGIKQWKQNLKICWKERKERKEKRIDKYS